MLPALLTIIGWTTLGFILTFCGWGLLKLAQPREQMLDQFTDWDCRTAALARDVEGKRTATRNLGGRGCIQQRSGTELSHKTNPSSHFGSAA